MNELYEHYSQLDSSLKSKIKYLIPDNIRNIIHPRYFKCFCIGTPKSGTTSIAGLFDKNFRASHEPERRGLIYYINDHYKGKFNDQEFVEWLRKRERRIWLDMESNCFLGYRVDLLYKAFPQYKYILSVRHPLSWLDSMMNHTINYPPTSEDVIKFWHSIFFQPSEYAHSEEDKALKSYSVYSVEAYLRFWARSVDAVLENIPKNQLLIVKTNEFNQSLQKVADYLDVSESKLDLKSGHLNKAPKKFNLLEKIEPGYVDGCINEFCSKQILNLEL